MNVNNSKKLSAAIDIEILAIIIVKCYKLIL